MRRVILPDGLGVLAFSDFEARLLYREIVSEQTYQRHGITIGSGSYAFDVGANIGLCAIHLATTIPGLHIRAYEPIATNFRALEANLAEHAPGVVAIHAALGATAGSALFEVDRFSSISSSMTPGAFPGAARKSATLADWIDAGLLDAERVRPGRLLHLGRRCMANPATRPVAIAALGVVAAGLEIRKKVFARREPCELRTLSMELAASGWPHLDFVKIDVEGAEEDVLAGIDDADWPRIRQLVIEVHDVDGRRERIGSALRDRGYAVVHDREDWAMHELLGISTIYAMRR